MTSKADLKRYDALVQYGCVCCKSLGIYSAPDMHHILSGGRRTGNKNTIPLCPWHHRGVKTYIDGNKLLLGPSLADGSKLFTARWGNEAKLLARVNAALQKERKKAIS